MLSKISAVEAIYTTLSTLLLPATGCLLGTYLWYPFCGHKRAGFQMCESCLRQTTDEIDLCGKGYRALLVL